MKSLKIVHFLGGLGNQMFQYAFYRTLEQYFEIVKADISAFKNYTLHNGFELERVFNLKLNYSSNIENIILGSGSSFIAKTWRKICRLLNRFYICKTPTYFDPHIFEESKSMYYAGYWQNERYFYNISDMIRQDFTFRNQLNDKNLHLKSLINNTVSVSIHVRRGDYVNHSALGNICDIEYYRKAINYINANISDAKFFIFSNDVSWCKENVQITNCYYIDWNIDKDSYMDMQLMSLCKHNIIANSSFSWWGAWLNCNSQKIIISPSKWFNNIDYDIRDIVPDSWICI